MFDREVQPSLDESLLRLIPKDDTDTVRIRLSNLQHMVFSGEDPAVQNPCPPDSGTDD